MVATRSYKIFANKTKKNYFSLMRIDSVVAFFSRPTRFGLKKW